MLQRTHSKFKACNSKALGCLYHCFRQKGQLWGDRRDIWERKGGDRTRDKWSELGGRVRRVGGTLGMTERKKRVKKGKKRGRGCDSTLLTAFWGLLCRCHQLFPCTEGSRAWNIASGPVLGHLSSVNQTVGVGGATEGLRTGGGMQEKGGA